jgi:hypothetical protein
MTETGFCSPDAASSGVVFSARAPMRARLRGSLGSCTQTLTPVASSPTTQHATNSLQDSIIVMLQSTRWLRVETNPATAFARGLPAAT